MKMRKEMEKENGKMYSRILGGRTFTCLCMLALYVCTGCNKVEDLQSVGTLAYDGKTYLVSIGNIGKNPSGNTTIELISDLKNKSVIVRGIEYPVFNMDIIVDKITVGWNYYYISEEAYEYVFSTMKNPDKIIVYTIDEKSFVTFDGKRKNVIK